MYVLMDIEWIENEKKQMCPTQIAALRVDDAWEESERFYVRIKPHHASFCRWEFMAFNGGSAEDFLSAKCLAEALRDLELWLNEDDILCWWIRDHADKLKSIYARTLHQQLKQESINFRKYLHALLKSHEAPKGNFYQTAEIFGVQPLEPRHYSLNDVLTMQALLKRAKFSTQYLKRPSGQFSNTACAEKEDWPYLYEPETGYVHKSGCEVVLSLSQSAWKGYTTLKTCLRKNYKPCQCIADEYAAAARERNIDIINRSEYQFIYAESSDVFHRRSCGLILCTKSVLRGTIYYKSCAKTGRRPCKVCHPTPESEPLDTQRDAPSKKRKAAVSTAAIPKRGMKMEEKRAYDRYVEAREERLVRGNTPFSSQVEKHDFYVLTQPRFAFWASAGYQTFHLRRCKRMGERTNFRGFAHYKDALRAGYKPCKLCRPTEKHDAVLSIPITNREHPGETVEILTELCIAHGYLFRREDHYFAFETPVGRWKVDISGRPYRVFHINLVNAPQNEYDYHQQPRLFLSLMDTFAYIHRHDTVLANRRQSFFESDFDDELDANEII